MYYLVFTTRRTDEDERRDMDKQLEQIVDLIASGMTLEQAEKQVENDYDR